MRVCLYTGGLIFGMERVLVNWWAYTWRAYIRGAYIRGLIFGGLIFGGLYSEVYGIQKANKLDCVYNLH